MGKKTFGAALGELIFQRRKALGLTQMQLAEEALGGAGNARRISELENGTVARPNPRTIDPIIAVLGITEAQVEECARQSKSGPDPELERAYVDARNLIEALARQFEHTNPDASFAELDRFLRDKAREWRDLRQRIQNLDAPGGHLSFLQASAIDALAEGRFDDVDRLLLEAEEIQQSEGTLREVEKQAQIRILRGDSALLNEDWKRAEEAYIGAAEYFRPFDEAKMVKVLGDLAGRIYEVGRRSAFESLPIAVALLQRALEAKVCQQDPAVRGKTRYRLGLVLRNAADLAPTEQGRAYLSSAIAHLRAAIPDAEATSDPFAVASTQVALGNALFQNGAISGDPDALTEAVDLFRALKSRLQAEEEYPELLAHACNGLGNSLMQLHRHAAEQGLEQQEALEAFRRAILASEEAGATDVWGAAQANIGILLSARAKSQDDDGVVFLRVRAIASYMAAIEMYPRDLFSYQFADIHKHLAEVLVDHSRSFAPDQAELYLWRALTSCSIAEETLDEKAAPSDWAKIQATKGRAYGRHALLDGVETKEDDLRRAEECFAAARQMFVALGEGANAEYCSSAIETTRQLRST